MYNRFYLLSGVLLLAHPAYAESLPPLASNQLSQGTLTTTLKGQHTTLRSIAVKMDKNLGKTVAQSMQNDKTAQKAIQTAKDKVPGSQSVKIKKSDVVDFANSFAGKTIYASQGRYMKYHDFTAISLAFEDTRQKINLSFSLDKNDQIKPDATINYCPDKNQYATCYYSDKVQINLSNLNQTQPDNWQLNGSFNARDLVYKQLFKNQILDDLPPITELQGGFAITHLPVKQ